MHGDGPGRRIGEQRVLAAPPHARGWSPSRQDAGLDRQGSPACAGMVPSCSTSARRPARLPRMRGDGPDRKAVLLGDTMAPPHARGWSLISKAPHRRLRGSPACAGMVPRQAARGGLAPRLPRMRGDGPDAILVQGRDAAAPPHARGWSQSRAPGGDQQRGSPACAGMVLVDPHLEELILGLPRMRGDGPLAGGGYIAGPGAPPHARGWSRLGVEALGLPRGSPACAGMVPHCVRACDGRRRLPRMRGDGPLTLSGTSNVAGAPPHARGWSRATC